MNKPNLEAKDDKCVISENSEINNPRGITLWEVGVFSKGQILI